MIFHSISARRLHTDPEPWVYADGSRHADMAEMVWSEDGTHILDNCRYEPREQYIPKREHDTNPILDLSRDSWDDDWGSALGWGFACCTVLEYIGEPIPDEWGYRASIAGSASDLADGSYESSETVAALGLGVVTDVDGQPEVKLFELEDIPNETWNLAADYAWHAARVFAKILAAVPEEDRY